ncbi:tyrosine-type recombinase/integrase [Zoogloea sp.]|uniref:tyrosine-type recombinase/integrase n=1 Tax=Zoogloea sp. TaxID=49181 RepID=UPI0035B03EEF
MQRERLTPDRIRRFSCPADAKQSFLWDTDAPRLAVRATAGAKSFIFEAKLNRQTVRVTIGDVKAWNLDDARAEARRLQTLIDQGTDPRQEKADKQAAIEARKAAAEAEQQEQQRQAVTVGEAWAAYVAARSHKWGDSHKRDHEKAIQPGGERITRGRKKGQGEYSLPGMVHSLLLEPLKDLTPERLTAWMQENNARGATEAAKNFRLLRAFLNWCAERPEYVGLVRADACRTSEVRDHVKAVKAKGDSLQREQLTLWFEHVRQLGNPVHAAYLQTALLTGARREELTGLGWADVDFQWKSLTIRDKVEGERIIPLTPYVAALLASLPRRNEWVFSSPSAESGRLQEPLKPHKNAMQAAGLPPFTLHDLRRSFGTLAEWCEVPVGVVAQIQGHKPSALAEKHYRRRPLDLLRMWHVKIEAWILEQAGIEQPGEGQAPELRVVG